MPDASRARAAFASAKMSVVEASWKGMSSTISFLRSDAASSVELVELKTFCSGEPFKERAQAVVIGQNPIVGYDETSLTSYGLLSCA